MPLPSKQVISVGEYQAKDYMGGSVQVLDLGSGKLETLYTGLPDRHRHDRHRPAHAQGDAPRRPSLRGPDDLVFDSAGGFWIADFGKSRPRDKDLTGIYYARADGSYIREKIFPLDGPNGIALSPAGDRLYASLTFRRTLLYWELDGPGSIRPNPETMDGAHVLRAGLPGDLDSIKVDEQGNVYALTILPEEDALLQRRGDCRVAQGRDPGVLRNRAFPACSCRCRRICAGAGRTARRPTSRVADRTCW